MPDTRIEVLTRNGIFMTELKGRLLNEVFSAGSSILFWKKNLNYILKSASGIIGALVPFSLILAKLEKRPLTLNLATTNICNAKCIFCAYRYLTLPKGFMCDGIFKKAVKDFIAVGGGRIDFTPNTGEPLLDPKLLERIRYCRNFPEIRKIEFTTNGILLHKIDNQALIRSGVNEIIISIGGINRESYCRVVGVDKFEEVILGITNLYRANKECGKPVKITVSLRTDQELKNIKAEAVFKKILKIANISYIYNYHSWGGKIRAEDLRGPMRFNDPKQRQYPCCKLYGGLTVYWNGDVTVCGCSDVNSTSELMLGNITDNSLIDLWRGGKLRNIRRDFRNGIFPDVCRVCTAQPSVKIYRRFDFLSEIFRQ